MYSKREEAVWVEKRTRRSKKGGKFAPHEDIKLRELVKKHGEDFEKISTLMPYRNVRQIKERWHYHLSPAINQSPFTKEEDELILSKFNEIGAKWSKMTPFFKNRTSSSLKNRYQLLERHKINGKEVKYDDKQICSPEEKEPEQGKKEQKQNEPMIFMEMRDEEIMSFWQDIFCSPDAQHELAVVDIHGFY